MKTFDVSNDYNRGDFADFLTDFLPDDFEPAEEKIYFEYINIEEGLKLGSVESLGLDVFEFRTKSNRDPRVILTKEVVSFMKKCGYNQNALVVFYSAESHSWRLSLITSDYEVVNGKVKPLYSNPRRFSFKLGEGCKKHTPESMLSKKINSFDDLKKRFDIEVVTKQFYQELFNWYEWACEIVTFPVGDTNKNKKGDYNVHQSRENNELNLIRLITRLMFIWFIKQKDLIPLWIFDENELQKILIDFDPKSKDKGNYYNAIIQNLFFATLNKKIEERAFADDKSISKNRQFGVKNFYRDNKDSTFFKENNDQVIERFKPVPFLNGGLFECLDRLVDDKENKKNIEVFIDGFSREPAWMAFIPNMLFWQEDDGKHEGLIHLLNRYNFTVEENSPADVQVALDPELLGKVFENLLGTYNPETSETARKDSGSFYTPREIVNFIVDEALKNYLLQTVKNIGSQQLDLLFDDNTQSYSEDNKNAVVQALKTVKILDPACGSGAFPMGALQRMILLIKKCGGITDNPDETYQLKLDLIENCLFGADIQPIAVQICKLRFFISLICEQEKTDNASDNYGFNPLPNLETKFVAANTLIEKKKKGNPSLFDNPEIDRIKKELQEKRHEHFNARTAELKAKYRKEDMSLRQKLADLLAKDSMCDQEDAKQLASWNPYDQNAVSSFFDPEWMFGIKDGFDIIIGNPPYIQLQKDSGKLAELYKQSGFQSFAKTGDIYCLFYEKGYELLKNNGYLCFITSNKWMRAGYGEKLRGFFAQKTNPKLLIDFAGVRIFESATVDTNILLFEKSANRKETKACVAKNLTENDLNNLSLFVQQNSSVSDFSVSESWVILSPIEQSIKRKIEAVGIPLKDWNISINYGIKTGFNEAFLINKEKREEILSNCQTEKERKRTDELIRPILRGRDIKRYSYDWAGLWLIWIPWHFPLHLDSSIQGASEKAEKAFKERYPSVYNHLLQYKSKLSARNKAETGIRYEWYALQRWGANYWEDFFKPKIIFQEIVQRGQFLYDADVHYMCNDTGRIIVGDHLLFILGILNSKVFFYAVKKFYGGGALGEHGIRMKHTFFGDFPCLPYNKRIEEIAKALSAQYTCSLANGLDKIIYSIYSFTKEEISEIESETISSVN